MREISSTAARERILVQVFAKAPVAGEVKTRLIPILGTHGATELDCRLVRHTLATVEQARVGHVEMWTTQPGESAFLQACKRPLGIPLHRQRDGDLGQRMGASIRHGLARASCVLLVGADVPTMLPDDLHDARDALARGHDAVLGPAEDGGYWLIGVIRHAPELFRDLPWSTPGLLDATRACLRALGWRWHELTTRWDIDRPEDLHRLASERQLGLLVADLLPRGVKRLVLVGGGHSHVDVLRRFGLEPLDDVEITLISPGRFTPYSGMLPGLVAGHYTFELCHIDLEGLSRFARASFRRDLAVGLDAAQKLLRCDSGASIPYDVLSLDIGAAPTRYFQRWPEDFGIPVRPVDRYLAAWSDVMREATQRPMDLVTVGGGAGGVEITLAMQHRLKQVAPGQQVRFAIVTMTDAILTGQANGVRKRLQRVLARRGIAVHARSRAVGLDGNELLLESGRRLHADRVFWAIGPQASEWLAEAGLQTDEAGFVLVNDKLQSLSHPDVFAAGDIATMARHRRPKSGVYAVRQGPALAKNLRRMLAGRALERYFPQPIALYLISTGDRYAVGSWGPFSLEGAWVWRWKDRIDRRFTRKYHFD